MTVDCRYDFIANVPGVDKAAAGTACSEISSMMIGYTTTELIQQLGS